MNFLKLLVVGTCMLALSACSSSHSHRNMNGDHHMGHSHLHESATEMEDKVGDRVFFEFDSSAITYEAQDILKKQASFMKHNSDLDFIIEGHCDERGTREYNLALGERRANSVKQFLVGLGVDSKRLTTVSFGKERPAVLGSNDWSWGQNRRGVTVAR